jgi:arylsulfatase A-like enzyme
MSRQPNIIFVHVDQLKWSAVGINGSDQVATPHMDRILSDAVRFDRSYAACPVCTPARTSWYTGLEPEQSGISENGRWIDRDEVQPVDLGTWLRDQGGYDSYYMGKWHVAIPPQECGFERIYGSNHVGEYGDTAVARAAENFLAERSSDKPFFLNIGLLNPHDICYWNFESSPSKFSMMDQMIDRLPELPPNFKAGEPVLDWTDEQWRFYAYNYFRLVEMVDEELGRIYRAYLKSPQRGNTVFVFSSDHGQAGGEHGFLTKGLPYEHSIRVPLAVVDPQAAARCDATSLVSGLDLAPTLCDYAGVSPMPRNHGQSLKPLIRGDAVEWRDWLAATTPRMKERVILKGDCKLVYERWSGKSRLYDLRKDPWETEDRSGDPQYARTVSELDALRRQYDAGREYCAMAKEYLNGWAH